MPAKICLDCGTSFEVEADQVSWRNHCYDCWKIRKSLKDQGLDKEEIEQVRQLAHPKKEVSVIQPAHDLDKAEGRLETMKKEYEGFVGDTSKKGMQFKEVSFSLGEKVSVDFQSKNAQIGTTISVGGVSPDLAYQSAVNFVKARLKERVKEIREEML